MWESYSKSLRNCLSATVSRGDGGEGEQSGRQVALRGVGKWVMLAALLAVVFTVAAPQASAQVAVESFTVDFQTVIDAMVTRVASYIQPLLLVGLGLLAIGVFISWTRRTAHG